VNKKCLLRWIGHEERMDQKRLTKEIYEAILSGNLTIERPGQKYPKQASVYESVEGWN
jgi:hypothetical protein